MAGRNVWVAVLGHKQTGVNWEASASGGWAFCNQGGTLWLSAPQLTGREISRLSIHYVGPLCLPALSCLRIKNEISCIAIAH